MTQVLDNGTAITKARSTVLGSMADRYSMDPVKLLDTIRATCIKGNATPEQVQAFLIVANRYGLDPFLKEIHAFAGQGGAIVPIVGIDGWTKIINGQKDFDGLTFEEFEDGEGKPLKTTCTIYVKGRSHPVSVTERYAECHRNTGPWNQYSFRMLRHKALMQCARVAFSVGGIYDEDEANDVIRNGMAITQQAGPSEATDRLNDRLKAVTSTQVLPSPPPTPTQQPATSLATEPDSPPVAVEGAEVLEAPKAEPVVEQKPEQPAPVEAPAAEAPKTPEPTKEPETPAPETWDEFCQRAWKVAHESGETDPKPVMQWIGTRVLGLKKKGKEHEISVATKERWIEAIRLKAIDYVTGKTDMDKLKGGK